MSPILIGECKLEKVKTNMYTAKIQKQILDLHHIFQNLEIIIFTINFKTTTKQFPLSLPLFVISIDEVSHSTLFEKYSTMYVAKNSVLSNIIYILY